MNRNIYFEKALQFPKLAVASGKMTREEVSLPRSWSLLEMYHTGPIL